MIKKNYGLNNQHKRGKGEGERGGGTYVGNAIRAITYER